MQPDEADPTATLEDTATDLPKDVAWASALDRLPDPATEEGASLPERPAPSLQPAPSLPAAPAPAASAGKPSTLRSGAALAARSSQTPMRLQHDVPVPTTLSDGDAVLGGVFVADVVAHMRSLAAGGQFFGNTSSTPCSGRNIYAKQMRFYCVEYRQKTRPRCAVRLQLRKLRARPGWVALIEGTHTHPPLPQSRRSNRFRCLLQSLADADRDAARLYAKQGPVVRGEAPLILPNLPAFRPPALPVARPGGPGGAIAPRRVAGKLAPAGGVVGEVTTVGVGMAERVVGDGDRAGNQKDGETAVGDVVHAAVPVVQNGAADEPDLHGSLKVNEAAVPDVVHGEALVADGGQEIGDVPGDDVGAGADKAVVGGVSADGAGNSLRDSLVVGSADAGDGVTPQVVGRALAADGIVGDIAAPPEKLQAPADEGLVDNEACAAEPAAKRARVSVDGGSGSEGFISMPELEVESVVKVNADGSRNNETGAKAAVGLAVSARKEGQELSEGGAMTLSSTAAMEQAMALEERALMLEDRCFKMLVDAEKEVMEAGDKATPAMTARVENLLKRLENVRKMGSSLSSSGHHQLF